MFSSCDIRRERCCTYYLISIFSLSGSVTNLCLFTPKLYVLLLRPEKNIRQRMVTTKTQKHNHANNNNNNVHGNHVGNNNCASFAGKADMERKGMMHGGTMVTNISGEINGIHTTGAANIIVHLQPVCICS